MRGQGYFEIWVHFRIQSEKNRFEIVLSRSVLKNIKRGGKMEKRKGKSEGLRGQGHKRGKRGQLLSKYMCQWSKMTNR